jgi:hypothetical protein
MLSAAVRLGKREKLRSFQAAVEQDQGQPQIITATHTHPASAASDRTAAMFRSSEIAVVIDARCGTS